MRLRLLAAVALAGCAAEGGRPPILDMVDDRTVAVGHELVVNLHATDPEGDELFFNFEADAGSIAETGAIGMRPDGTGVFRWTPMADDIGSWAIDYIVSDGQSEDRVTALIDVTAGEPSAPEFRSPTGSGAALDLAEEDCLRLDVVVEDADNADVGLGQAEPVLPGAVLEQTGGLEGVWRWCPVDYPSDTARLRLFADDGLHPPTFKDFLIVLRHPEPDEPDEPKEPSEPAEPKCEDDDFEDNDSREEAAVQGAIPPGQYSELMACPDDEDWYRLELDGDGVLTVEGDIPTTLHDHRGEPIEGDPCLPPGAYYVRVSSPEERPYALDVALATCR